MIERTNRPREVPQMLVVNEMESKREVQPHSIIVSQPTPTREVKPHSTSVSQPTATVEAIRRIQPGNFGDLSN